MRQPIRWDLYGDRGVPFSDTLPIVGRDFTAAAFTAQVRAVPDAGGSPVKTLTVTLTYGGSDTVANHITAGRIGRNIYDYVNPNTGAGYVASDTIALSVLNVAVTDMTASLPAASPTGGDVALAWDMLIDPSGAPPIDKWIYGSFTVRGTVTQ